MKPGAWSEQEIAALRLGWARGDNKHKIAADMGTGRTGQAIYSKAKDLGLPNRGFVGFNTKGFVYEQVEAIFQTRRDISAPFLQKKTGKGEATIHHILNRMLREGLIHVSSYKQQEGRSGLWARQFTWGKGENVPPPQPTSKQVREKRYRAKRRKQERAEEAMNEKLRRDRLEAIDKAISDKARLQQLAAMSNPFARSI